MGHCKFIMVALIMTSLMLVLSTRNVNAAPPGGAFGLQAGLAQHGVTVSGSGINGAQYASAGALALRAYLGGNFFSGGLIGLEAGSSVQDRKYTVTMNSVMSELSYSVFLLDVMMRLNIEFLSLGFGPYVSASLGTVTVNQAGTTQIVTMGAAGLAIIDTGLIASARAALPISSSISLTGDGRYLFGTADIANTDQVIAHTREMQVLGGLQFGF